METTDRIVVEVPEWMAQELAAATQDFLAEILQRGLRETRIERALSRCRLGGMTFAAAAEAAGASQAGLARHAYVRNNVPLTVERHRQTPQPLSQKTSLGYASR